MQDHTIFKDLESLQSAYSSTFSESNDHTSYEGYLQRCNQRKIPQSAIMSEEEWNTMESNTYLNKKEDEESYLAPKTKMTEEEAMEWFSNSDNFHQLFHKFMEQQHYSEKEVNGKQFWIKSK